MSRGKLIDAVAAKAEVSPKDADATVTTAATALETIAETVAGGEEVFLAGFGSFEPHAHCLKVFSAPCAAFNYIECRLGNIYLYFV
ncbi:HU family DNA-binding protein [Leptolyngbya sp. BC1307]|uniref:HU family DNA-binding protein n=1 Tax=Leptolyngbya sp. BC1307 TaxID=2029589 RepID=UPI000EFBF6D2